MSQNRDITVEELREFMLTGLKQSGWNQDEINGYVAAQERSGWLRPKCPAWLRNSAAVYYALPVQRPANAGSLRGL